MHGQQNIKRIVSVTKNRAVKIRHVLETGETRNACIFLIMNPEGMTHSENLSIYLRVTLQLLILKESFSD
jgi:hypothetical protein